MTSGSVLQFSLQTLRLTSGDITAYFNCVVNNVYVPERSQSANPSEECESSSPAHSRALKTNAYNTVLQHLALKTPEVHRNLNEYHRFFN